MTSSSLPMNVQASELQSLNNLLTMQALLANMQANIYLISQGAAGQIITVTNANLFQLAAQYYNDARKWTAIAEANGLVDPVVQTTISLELNDVRFLTFEGFAQSEQSIEIDLNLDGSGERKYFYSISEYDTLESVVKNVAQVIPGAEAFHNVILLPDYITLRFNVYRFASLVIPQTAQDQGGILEVS